MFSCRMVSGPSKPPGSQPFSSHIPIRQYPHMGHMGVSEDGVCCCMLPKLQSK